MNYSWRGRKKSENRDGSSVAVIECRDSLCIPQHKVLSFNSWITLPSSFAKVSQFCETLKTRVELNLINCTQPHAITLQIITLQNFVFRQWIVNDFCHCSGFKILHVYNYILDMLITSANVFTSVCLSFCLQTSSCIRRLTNKLN